MMEHKVMYSLIFVVIFQNGLRSFAQEPPHDPSQQLEDILKQEKYRGKGAEYAVVIFHRVNTQAETSEKISSDLLQRHRRDTKDDETAVDFVFSAFNEDFRISLRHNTHLLDARAPVTVRYGDQVALHHGDIPDCFMVGNTSRGGVASLAYCKGLKGSILEGAYQYDFRPLQQDEADDVMLVSKVKVEAARDQLMAADLGQVKSNAQSHFRRKRATSTSFTLEVAVHWDELLYAIMEDVEGATTLEDKLMLTAIKWNGVQSILGVSDDLGYSISVKIVSVEFWQTNPSWFAFAATELGPTLSSFCASAYKYALPADHYHLHTRVQSSQGAGLSYQPGTCINNLDQRCAISCDTEFAYYELTAHEVGHSLYMGHDENEGCDYPNNGMMSTITWTRFYGWSTCSAAALHTFVTTVADQTCLFQENVTPSSIDSAVAALEINGEWIGMTYSEDELCQMRHGAGWYSRLWFLQLPNWDEPCQYRSCINMNPGPKFGIMQNYYGPAEGLYCGDRLVCIELRCVSWSQTRLPDSLWVPVAGGWTEWSAISSCSMTCGRGTMIRRRSCTNPVPKYGPMCEGLAVEATVCTNNPCADESHTFRAGEVCSRLITAGVLSATEYDGTGARKGFTDVGSCEVKCFLSGGSNPEANARFSLLPDGTDCNGVDLALDIPDINGYSRAKNTSSMCVQGYCQKIGCDGTNYGKEVDGCGVCGGDGSTCTVYQGVYTNILASGETGTMVTIPAGANFIQIWFKYGLMKVHYIELYDESNTVIIATKQNGIKDTSLTPVNALGTDWNYLLTAQYLYTYGTVTTATAVVKLFNFGTNQNVGVSWAYSIPKAGTTQASTTKAPTTQEPTTQAPTTQPPTTQHPTTQPPTTQPPTTQPPTTNILTTPQPTTQPPTTKAQTNQVPTTKPPTTQPPTTQEPNTQASTTQPPKTQPPTTQPPTTQPPTTQPPTTQPPKTQPPTTQPPITQPRCMYLNSRRRK